MRELQCCSGESCGSSSWWVVPVLLSIFLVFFAYRGWDQYRQALRRREADEDFLTGQSNSNVQSMNTPAAPKSKATRNGDTSGSSLHTCPIAPPPHFPSGGYGGQYGDCLNFRNLYPNGRIHDVPSFELTFVDVENIADSLVPGMFTVHGKGQDRIGEYIVQGRHAVNPFRMVLIKTYQRGTIGVSPDVCDINGREEGYYLAEDHGGDVRWMYGGTDWRNDPMGNYHHRRNHYRHSIFDSSLDQNHGHEVHMRLMEAVDEKTGRHVLQGRYYFSWHLYHESGQISFWPLPRERE